MKQLKNEEGSYILTSSESIYNCGNLFLSEVAYQQLKKLGNKEENCNYLHLRIEILGGGCSGFQYQITLDERKTENDIFFTYKEAKLVVDKLSLNFLNGSTIDYLDEIMVSHFFIKNPNAKLSCGCGNSFSLL